jgi:hypothetical protein
VWGPSLGNCLLARSLEGRKRGVYNSFALTLQSLRSLTASTSLKNQLRKFSKRFSWKTPWPDLRNDIEASVRGIGALGSPKFATLYCNSPSCLAPAPRNVSRFLLCIKSNVSTRFLSTERNVLIIFCFRKELIVRLILFLL